MKTILAPIDFSPVSERVVHEAAELARTFDGRVVLLCVVQPPVAVTEYVAMIDVAQLTAASTKSAAEQLDALEEKLKRQFIKAESVHITGIPVGVILEQADKQEADYIVMGSHGHTAFYDLLVGSTTHGVLARAKCPVVIVPRVKADAKPRRSATHAAVV
jgi:nucleotide-binding universal stress UspA family protein